MSVNQLIIIHNHMLLDYYILDCCSSYYHNILIYDVL